MRRTGSVVVHRRPRLLEVAVVPEPAQEPLLERERPADRGGQLDAALSAPEIDLAAHPGARVPLGLDEVRVGADGPAVERALDLAVPLPQPLLARELALCQLRAHVEGGVQELVVDLALPPVPGLDHADPGLGPAIGDA